MKSIQHLLISALFSITLPGFCKKEAKDVEGIEINNVYDAVNVVNGNSGYKFIGDDSIIDYLYLEGVKLKDKDGNIHEIEKVKQRKY